MDSLLGLQLVAIFPEFDLRSLFGVPASECAGLHAWVSNKRGYCVGIAHARRASRPSSCGIACRWLEHTLTLRAHCRDSNKLQYKLVRGLSPDNDTKDTKIEYIKDFFQIEVMTSSPSPNFFQIEDIAF